MFQPRDYRITWNGEEYVASCTPLLIDARGSEAEPVTGHSRHPGSAMVALLQKLSELGITVLPPPESP